MKKYVTCRVVDTVPLRVSDNERPTTTCKLGKVMRTSHRQPRKPDPSEASLKSLIGRTYAHYPFPPGQSLNIAI